MPKGIPNKKKIGRPKTATRAAAKPAAKRTMTVKKRKPGRPKTAR